MKLYELNNLVGETLDELDLKMQEDSNFDYSIYMQLLNDIDIAKEEKILSIAKYYKELQYQSEAIKSEIDKLRSKQQSINCRLDFFESYINKNYDNKDKKINDTVISVSWRKSEQTSIFDIDKVPNDYKTLKTEIVAKKDEIKKAIKDGISIDGAEIITNYNLQIK